MIVGRQFVATTKDVERMPSNHSPDGASPRGIYLPIIALAIHLPDPLRLSLEGRSFDFFHHSQLTQHILDQAATSVQRALQARHLTLILCCFFVVLQVPQLQLPALQPTNESRTLVLPTGIEAAAETHLEVGVEKVGRVRVVVRPGAGGLELVQRRRPALKGADETVVFAAGRVEGPQGREQGVETPDLFLEDTAASPVGGCGGRRGRPAMQRGHVDPLRGVGFQRREFLGSLAQLRVPGREFLAGGGVPLGRHGGQLAVQEVELQQLGLQTGGLRGQGDVGGEL